MKTIDNSVTLESLKAEDIDFQQWWFILKRRFLPAATVFATIVALVFMKVSSQDPVYQTSGKLLIKPDNSANLTGVGKNRREEFTPLTEQGNPLKTETEVILSNPLLEKTITALNMKDQQGKVSSPDSMKKLLKVKTIGGADVLEISYEDTDSKRAAAVINQLMKLYIENNIRINRAEAVAARDFIAKELPETEMKVRKADAALRDFKEQNKVVNLEAESQSAVEATTLLEDEINKARAALADATARSQGLRGEIGMSSRQAVTASSLSESAGVQQVLEQYQKVESQLALERSRFEDGHPTIVNLASQKASLEALLKQRVQQATGNQEQVPSGNLQIGETKADITKTFVDAEVQRLGLAKQLDSLTKAYANYRERTNVLPKLEQEQRELQRRMEAAQATYATLLTNLQQIQVAENQNIGNARIIEPAPVPKQPYSGKKSIILFLGGIAGALLSGATILILEARDKSIKTVKQTRELFGYTLLGAIPSYGRSGKIIRHQCKDSENYPATILVRDDSRSPISEVYRMLQANLKFLSSDEELKVILVASSVPKEGKSTVTANLATAMAQVGRRVLLVDADMRHPVQHHIWDLTNQVGLSNVIVNQADLSMAVKEVLPNLDVLTCGVVPPNPVALLDSKRMAAMIESFREDYDFVIIDVPPVVLAADALILGKMTDGILMVGRPGVLDSASAVAARESLTRSCQNVLGLVVNGAIPKNEPDSYFYYTKGYYAEEDLATRRNRVASRR